jgi:hypothetical protein
VRLFWVCVVLCVALLTGYHLPKESYRLCKKDYETEEVVRTPKKGCRGIDILCVIIQTAEEKTKGSGLNGSKHYPSSISS